MAIAPVSDPVEPTPAQEVEATAAQQDQQGALEEHVDAVIGTAVRILIGTCMGLDTTQHSMQVQRQDQPQTFAAQYGDLPVSNSLVGQSVLCLQDPVTHLVYFRIGLSGTSTGTSSGTG